MKAVIMAGGKGTRIAAVDGSVPKPMLRLLGKPVLEHQIECLASQGFTDIIVVVGHLGDIITGYFGDGSGISPSTGKPFGVNIEYYRETSPLGTAGALFCIKDRLTDDFLLLNGDLLFDVDLARFVAAHKRLGGAATVLAHPNSHPFDSALLVADEKSRVTDWLAKGDERPFCKNRVNAGIHLLSAGLLEPEAGIFTGGRLDLDRDVLRPLIARRELFVYDSPEYILDMGTPERLAMAEKDLRSGLPRARCLSNRQRAVFLDRDGVINRENGFIARPDQLELLPGAAGAVARINRSGFLAIVVTNQPVIARGEATVEQLDEIHNKLETLLGREGAFLDGIYYCPHHPDGGFAGEIPELKKDCDCRKPKPGMLLAAARALNIELSESWMAGDRETDIQAGASAGCRCAIIGDRPEGCGAARFPSLAAFADTIIPNIQLRRNR